MATPISYTIRRVGAMPLATSADFFVTDEIAIRPIEKRMKITRTRRI